LAIRDMGVLTFLFSASDPDSLEVRGILLIQVI